MNQQERLSIRDYLARLVGRYVNASPSVLQAQIDMFLGEPGTIEDIEKASRQLAEIRDQAAKALAISAAIIKDARS